MEWVDATVTATFGTAYGVGRGVDPLIAASAPVPHDEHREASPRPDEGGAHAGHEGTPPGGLQGAGKGYSLGLAASRVTVGRPAELRFTVRDSEGEAVTAYRREHEKELHLIVASRDLVTFRHLHPTRAADGTWRTPVDLPRAGGYRVFADFTPPRRASATSPPAPTSPPPATASPRSRPPPPAPPAPTATRSNSPGPCAPARRAS